MDVEAVYMEGIEELEEQISELENEISEKEAEKEELEIKLEEAEEDYDNFTGGEYLRDRYEYEPPDTPNDALGDEQYEKEKKAYELRCGLFDVAYNIEKDLEWEKFMTTWSNLKI